MKKQKNVCRLGMKISLAVLAIQFVVFTVLFLFIDSSVSASAKSIAVNNMQTAALDRS